MLEGYVRADFLNEAESAQGTAPPLRLPYNASVGPRELAAHTAAPIATKSPAAPPAKAETAKVWIPTGGGTKYHARADCSGMRAPRLVTLEEAIVEGYQDACKKCF